MYHEITALFYDDHNHRHLIAEGRYHPPTKGGWVDGKKAEPDEEAWMELRDVTTEEGGSVLPCEIAECMATRALWEEVEG